MGSRPHQHSRLSKRTTDQSSRCTVESWARGPPQSHRPTRLRVVKATFIPLCNEVFLCLFTLQLVEEFCFPTQLGQNWIWLKSGSCWDPGPRPPLPSSLRSPPTHVCSCSWRNIQWAPLHARHCFRSWSNSREKTRKKSCLHTLYNLMGTSRWRQRQIRGHDTVEGSEVLLESVPGYPESFWKIICHFFLPMLLVTHFLPPPLKAIAGRELKRYSKKGFYQNHLFCRISNMYYCDVYAWQESGVACVPKPVLNHKLSKYSRTDPKWQFYNNTDLMASYFFRPRWRNCESRIMHTI